MINYGKHSVLGINVHAVDYEYAVAEIVAAAQAGRPYAVSALAVHGVMTGNMDPVHARRLNGLDLVVPDGQPVRMALRWLHGKKLADRVYGPNLTLFVVEACARAGLPIFLYGSRPEVVDQFRANLGTRFPALKIAGYLPSRFKQISESEAEHIAAQIHASGAKVVLVGLGCPRQEVWAFEYRTKLSMPILAVGAAFDFHAGTLSQAPAWMQRLSLEWLYRLFMEPARLWRRYLLLNPLYCWRVLVQRCTGKYATPIMPDGSEPLIGYA